MAPSHAKRSGRSALILLLVLLTLGLSGLFAWLSSGGSGTGTGSDIALSEALHDAPLDTSLHQTVTPVPTRATRQASATAPQPKPTTPHTWNTTVRDPRGRGIPDVELKLIGDSSTLSAHTNPAGRCQLSWPGGDASLELHHPDFTPLRRAHVDFRLPGEFELQPAAELLVFLRGPAPSELIGGIARLFELRGDDAHRSDAREAALLENGTFQFRGLEPGEHALLVDLPGYAFQAETRFVIAGGERLEITLDMARASALTGRVHFPDGEAVQGARVVARPVRQGMWRELGERVAREVWTDEEGRYRIDELASASHVIEVDSSWGGEARVRVELPDEGRELVCDIEVTRAAAIEGRVVDAAGRAAPEAWVALAWKGSRAFLAIGDEGPREREGSKLVRADSKGHFRIDEVPAGRELRLFAVDRHAALESPTGHVIGFRLKSGEQRRDLELRLQHCGRLRGRVVSTDGRAIAEARIWIKRSGKGDDPLLAKLRTAEDGSFDSGGLPAGTLRIEVRHDEHLRLREPFELEEGAELELTLEMIPAPVLHGVVQGPRGFAVPFARVRAECAEPAVEHRGAHSKRNRWADEFGRFSFDDLGLGEWRISAHALGWRATGEGQLVRLPYDSLVTIELDVDPARHRARVVGELTRSDGSTPEGVHFGSLRGGSLQMSGKRFRVSGAAPGRMKVRIEAEGCVPVVVGPFVLQVGDVHDVGLVELHPGTRFAVELRGPDGKKLRGARVRLSPIAAEEGGPTPAPKPRVLRETRPGRYAVAATPLGKYRLRVKLAGWRRFEETLEVRQRPAQDRRVKLERAKEAGVKDKEKKARKPQRKKEG